VLASPTEDLSPRAAATVRGILDAAARLFAERGYHGTGVDDVVAEAGFARATFYKYFDDKLDLLRRLSVECRAVALELTGGLAAVEPGPEGSAALRNWLVDFLPFHRRYLGVFRAWVDGVLTDPELIAAAEQGNAAMRSAAMTVLERVERSYPLDLDVAAAVFLAVLDRMPEAVFEVDPGATREDIVTLMGDVIERGLLNGRSAPA
jgi:AcrR family transcriptional regulator